MHLRGIHIDKIEPDDIKNLVENGVPESTNLDYKEELPNLKEKGQKLKWLALVSSFANKDGGVIVYGIREERDNDGKHTGVPAEITGLAALNFGDVSLQMDQILSASLDPSLMGVRYKEVQVEGMDLFLVGVPRSLFSPHVVWFEKDGRFWIRNNAGKEQMDVRQLRQAFLRSEELEKTTDNFRRKRLMDIHSLEFTHELDLDFPYFIHIVPLMLGDFEIEVSALKEHLPMLQTNPHGYYSGSVNLDGVLLSLVNGKTQAYIHGFRNGSIEIFTTAPRREANLGDRSTWSIDGRLIETYTLAYLERYLAYAQVVNISPPVVLYLSLMNVKGIYLFANPDWIKDLEPDHKRFDRDVVLLPGQIVDTFDKDALDVLKWSFDILWQAAGWDQSAMKEQWEKRRKQIER